MTEITDWLTRHFQDLDDVGTAFFAAALVLAGLSRFLQISALANLALAAFGAAVITSGADAVRTGEVRILQHGIRVSESIQALLARAWGIVFIGGGMVLMGYGILAALNPRTPIPNTVQQFFQGTVGTGVLVLVGSAIGLLYALSMMFAAEAHGSNAFVNFVASLPGRIFGVIVAIIALAVMGIALIQIFAPGVWENWTRLFWSGIAAP